MTLRRDHFKFLLTYNAKEAQKIEMMTEE